MGGLHNHQYQVSLDVNLHQQKILPLDNTEMDNLHDNLQHRDDL